MGDAEEDHGRVGGVCSRGAESKGTPQLAANPHQPPRFMTRHGGGMGGGGTLSHYTRHHLPRKPSHPLITHRPQLSRNTYGGTRGKTIQDRGLTARTKVRASRCLCTRWKGHRGSHPTCPRWRTCWRRGPWVPRRRRRGCPSHPRRSWWCHAPRWSCSAEPP